MLLHEVPGLDMTIDDSVASSICRPKVCSRFRTMDDERSKKTKAMFDRLQSTMNDWVVEVESTDYALPCRWLRAKPSTLPGAFSYGCGLCFHLVSSKAWSEALKSDVDGSKGFKHGAKRPRYLGGAIWYCACHCWPKCSLRRTLLDLFCFPPR